MILPLLVLLVAASPPPAPERLGVEGLDSRRLAGLMQVDSNHVLDYTFGSAPTDWEPGGGSWAITSRYACEPEWSFFGGQSRGLCAIWNKREFRGDIAVEAYVAFKHGLPWAAEQWSYQPTDLNLSLCAQPGDLSSGYSFIYSGNGGGTTMIRQGQRVLAATTERDYLLPQFLDENPLFGLDAEGRPYGRFHRHWWHLLARREHGRLQFWVEGRKALDVAEVEPPQGGRVALWTINSGIVVARLRIAYEAEGGAAPAILVVSRPAALPSPQVASR